MNKNTIIWEKSLHNDVKMHRLFVIIFFVIVKIMDTNGDAPLRWDDPIHSDIGCGYPKGIDVPQHIIDAFVSFKSFRLLNHKWPFI